MSAIEVGRKPILPTGRGWELNQYVYNNRREHLVELAHVQNSVLWVNPEFKFAPFDLQVGKPTPLGMFIKSNFAKGNFAQKSVNLQDGQFLGETWPSHQRSVLLGRLVIRDNQSRMYRDIDIKGCGWEHLEFENEHLGAPMGGIGDDNYRGLLNRQVAEYDQKMSERFLSLDIRTSRTIAIIGLEQLIDEDKVVSVGNFLRKRNIPLDFKPVLQLRAFGTKARIKDIKHTNYIDVSGVRFLVNDAKRLISQELGWKRSMADEGYLEWFAKTLGKNVGLMHRKGWTHKYLGVHNVTLDCRIVDLDSVDPLETREQLKIDFDTVETVFDDLTKTFFLAFDKRYRSLSDLFYQSYEETFSPEEQMDYFRKGEGRTGFDK